MIIVDKHITGQDFPDPDLIRVNDTYYMASTTMYFYPGCAILRSFDLVNWEIASYVFDHLDNTRAERLEDNQNEYGKGMWAPSFRFHDGRFYIAFVSHGQEDTHLFISESINGPWEHKMIKGYYHDCSLLFDEDRVFIVHGNTDIHLTELKKDLTGPKPGGIEKIIISDNRDEVRLGYEGSHFYKINGKYVITLIHWPKEGMRTESIFISDQVDGEYKGFDCLHHDRGYCGQGVAQGGLIDTPEGKWYAMLFQDSGAVGRIPVLVPVKWNDGIPEFGEKGTVPETFTVESTRPQYQYESLINEQFATFKGKEAKINPQWQWNHVPKDELWSVNIENELRIKTGKISVNPLQAQNTLTQRITYPGSEAEVTVDYSYLNVGDTAGIMVLLGKYVMAGVKRMEDGYHAVVLTTGFKREGFAIGCEDYKEPVVLFDEKIEKADKKCRIKAVTDFTDMKDTVEMYIDDEKVTKEPVKVFFNLDLFTGARYALCMYSGKCIGGEAVFKEFNIK